MVNSLRKIKIDRDLLREECCEIKKQVSATVEEYERLKEKMQKLEYKGRLKSQEELNIWIEKKEELSLMMNEKYSEKVRLAEKIQEEIKVRSSEMNDLDDLCKMLRKKIEIVLSAQTKHYFGLLSEGKDTKGEGLQWIVMTLWKLGQTVSLESFPPFLDEDAVHCILFISQKSLEADQIIEHIVNPARKSTTYDKSIDRSTNIQQRLANLTKNLKVERPEYIYDKKNRQVNVKWIPCDTSFESNDYDELDGEINVYESYISKIKEMIQMTKESEIQRLAFECSLHRYQERYKVTIKDLIGAIVGNESSERHLAVTLKQQKMLNERIESTRTFNFTSRLIS